MGYIMSDVARRAYLEASYSVSKQEAINIGLRASQEAHNRNINHFSSLEAYMDAHSDKGTEINIPAGRSMISFSTDGSVNH